MGTSLRKMYDAELMALDTMLARMGHAAGGAIESAMTALRTGDAEMARSVIARDSEIDAAEHEIEHRCLTLFLRQQPVAGCFCMRFTGRRLRLSRCGSWRAALA